MPAAMFRSTLSARPSAGRDRLERRRAVGTILLAAAVGASLLAYHLEASSAYRPWAVLAWWLVSIAVFVVGAGALDGDRRKLERLSIPRWERAAVGR